MSPHFLSADEMGYMISSTALIYGRVKGKPIKKIARNLKVSVIYSEHFETDGASLFRP